MFQVGFKVFICGADRNRTDDPLLAKQVLWSLRSHGYSFGLALANKNSLISRALLAINQNARVQIHEEIAESFFVVWLLIGYSKEKSWFNDVHTVALDQCSLTSQRTDGWQQCSCHQV